MHAFLFIKIDWNWWTCVSMAINFYMVNFRFCSPSPRIFTVELNGFGLCLLFNFLFSCFSCVPKASRMNLPLFRYCNIILSGFLSHSIHYLMMRAEIASFIVSRSSYLFLFISSLVDVIVPHQTLLSLPLIAFDWHIRSEYPVNCNVERNANEKKTHNISFVIS